MPSGVYTRKEDKQALVDLVREEIELHKAGKLETLSTNPELADLMGICRWSVTRFLLILDVEDRDYRTNKIRQQIGINAFEQGKGVHARTPEQMSENGRKLFEQGKGVHARTPEQMSENGRKLFEQGKGVHGMTIEQRSENGRIGGRKAVEMSMIVEYNGNKYHSASEAAVAGLFEKYIGGWKVEKGKTWQVRDGLDNGGIDFLVNGVFVEYHPPRPYYSKRGGDLRDRREYGKYKAIKERIRERRGEDRARDFDGRVKDLIARKYLESRQEDVGNSSYAGTPLVYCRDVHAGDVYDKVISQYGNNIPSREKFVYEFKRLVRDIKKSNLELKKSKETSENSLEGEIVLAGA